MRIPQQRWDHIQRHANVRDRQAPAGVVLSIASAIGDADIVASWSGREFGQHTIWTCWAVTPTTLGYARVEYQREWYDLVEETTNPVVPSSQSAWVRPLASVIALESGSYFKDERQKDAYYPLGPMKITFQDITFAMPGPKGFSADDRDRANTFIKAIHAGVRF
jgi:hypothetical protein